MATSATEGYHPGEALLSEAPGTLSRESVTVVSGQNLAANDVVGKITASGKIAIYANGASDGTEAAYGVLLYAVDASSADAAGVVIERLAEFKYDALGWGANDATGKTAGTADLLTRNIKLRT